MPSLPHYQQNNPEELGEIIKVNPWKIAQYNHTKTKHKESMLMFYDT